MTLCKKTFNLTDCYNIKLNLIFQFLHPLQILSPTWTWITHMLSPLTSRLFCVQFCFDLSVETRCRWCTTHSSREATNHSLGRSESDKLCSEPDTHSGLGQNLWTYGPTDSLGDCTMLVSAWTQCYSSQLLYCHPLSTNLARDAEWCQGNRLSVDSFHPVSIYQTAVILHCQL